MSESHLSKSVPPEPVASEPFVAVEPVLGPESTLGAEPVHGPEPTLDPASALDPASPLDLGSAPDPATVLDPEIAAWLKRDAAGLVPAVVQEEATGEVLMVGWMDDEALRLTLTTGRSTFFSRSRNEYWVKGEISGHRQWVHDVRLDCDGDTLLLKVRQEGPACHTGDRTCFDARPLSAVVNDPALVAGETLDQSRDESPASPDDASSDRPGTAVTAGAV